MKKLFLASAVFLSVTAPAQTLFHYGSDSVSAPDFIQAFRKNNPGAKGEKALLEYLDLYIASKLKIKEARAQGYDTLPQFVADLDNLRFQVMPQYLNDKAALDKLVNEAFDRSQKDIRVGHIFISFANGDSLAAKTKATEALNKLKTASLADVAKAYSNDPSVKENGGDLGWITAFSLPYEIENLIYATAVGKTALYRSRNGYHIFKNGGERKAFGKMKAAQILLAFPPDADAASKAAVKKLADSIYNRLQKGDDFGKLASAFSSDVVSGASGGQLAEFGIGQYHPAFENTVYALADGAISKPFATTHGYHIVKRVKRLPPAAVKEEKVVQELREKVEANDRMAWAKKSLSQKVLKEGDFKKAAFDEKELWLYTDSILLKRESKKMLQVTEATPLFTLGKKSFTVKDWFNHSVVYGYKPDGSGVKPYDQIWTEFIEQSAADYYQNNLEDFNGAFKKQISEFKDGNLFFEIMQKKIWEPAQTDTAALKSFYEQRKEQYKWNKSATAVVFFSSDVATGNLFLKELSKAPAEWSNLIKNYSEKIAADSGRFELDQVVDTKKHPAKNGMITSPVINTANNSSSFAYIIQINNTPQQKSFAEAKGQLINDYQAELEKKWLAELKAKYPVQVNNTVVKNIVKDKSW